MSLTQLKFLLFLKNNPALGKNALVAHVLLNLPFAVPLKITYQSQQYSAEVLGQKVMIPVIKVAYIGSIGKIDRHLPQPLSVEGVCCKGLPFGVHDKKVHFAVCLAIFNALTLVCSVINFERVGQECSKVRAVSHSNSYIVST